MFLHLSPFLQGGRRGFLRQGVFTRPSCAVRKRILFSSWVERALCAR